ncbi:MAG: hypothetical protein O7H41_01275 [Planctomycetota bacterium]|nr:hypothetical protein [Planctomycetota bacterium]
MRNIVVAILVGMIALGAGCGGGSSSKKRASCSDDLYEPNDSFGTAYDLTFDEQTFISTIAGLGATCDDDVFEIFVDSGFENVQVDVLFTDAFGDIDVDLYDSGFNLVAASTSITNDEFIDVNVAPGGGTFYIWVYEFVPSGNTYDLWWDDLPPTGCPDDAYEPNDTFATAYDLTFDERTFISTLLGLGATCDDDVFEIFVNVGFENVQVDVLFTDAFGDIDIQLYDSGFNLVATSTSITNDEFIDVNVAPGGGTFYIWVYENVPSGNTYDLWWDDLAPTGCPDDFYEPNNDFISAYDLSFDEQTFISAIAGLGATCDDDVFEIFVDSGFENVQVDVLFTHAFGDIDIQLYDSGFNLVADSLTTTDDEFINVTVASGGGTFYIWVYEIGPSGNTYDLWWDDIAPGCVDDAYEPNNTFGTAYDLSLDEGIFLSTIAGLGATCDDDVFEIFVNSGFENVQVDVLFTDAQGDIDVEIYDAGFNLITGSYSITDDEFIDVVVAGGGGTFYIRVFENIPSGNTYDLWWDDIAPGCVDDAYEPNNTFGTAYDLSFNAATFISTLAGLGATCDGDYYEIFVSPGALNVLVDVFFSHASGDIEVELYDAAGFFVDGSFTSSDDESIDVIVPAQGTYYIYVYEFPSGTGNTYDLWWDNL